MKIYCIALSEIQKVDIGFFKKHFPNRYKRSEKFVKYEDCLRCLGVGILLKDVLDIDENEIKINEFGKPYVTDKNVYFNISHSGNYVILAINDTPIGVDIEQIDKKNLFVAKKVYKEDEIKWLKEDELYRFHLLWTMKESIMKAEGKGMIIKPISFSVLPIIYKKKFILNNNIWYCKSCDLDDYVISVCTKTPVEKIEIINVKK